MKHVWHFIEVIERPTLLNSETSWPVASQEGGVVGSGDIAIIRKSIGYLQILSEKIN